MSSFVDILKSERDAAIQKGLKEKDYENRLMECKDEITDSIIKLMVDEALVFIKRDLIAAINNNPQDSFVKVRYLGGRRGYANEFGNICVDLIEVFKQYGFDFTTNPKGMYKIAEKMGFKGVVYSEKFEDCEMPLSLVELFETTSIPVFLSSRKISAGKLTNEGIKFAKILTEKAAQEGIVIKYKQLFQEYSSTYFNSLTKDVKKEEYLDECSFVTASVRI